MLCGWVRARCTQSAYMNHKVNRIIWIVGFGDLFAKITRSLQMIQPQV